MGLRLFNTLSRAVQDFAPLDPAGKQVGLYCCGPTVHDSAHIGNFRTFVFADLVRRHLEFKGYAVTHVMNVTDVEDKIIARVRAAGLPLGDYTAGYETAFFEDARALNCLPPHHTPRATGHIGEMIALIEQLLARGMAYRAPDGSVYFSIEKYRAGGGRYGQLVHLKSEELRPGERVRHDEYAKESAADFALWKARVAEDGAVFWPSPWGEGRPGWHIECSAMSMKLLGPSFDLHLGGEDLIFPHHEDEIAQSEGAGLQAAGQRFVRHWLHCAHLLVDGKKMSKSLGNFFTLRDLLAKGYSGREIRYSLLQAHYREPFNFTLDGLDGARSALARLDECLTRLREVAGDTTEGPDPALLRTFTEGLDDDLNVSAAWGAIFEWVRQVNRSLAAGTLAPRSAAAALAAWEEVNAVLGIETATSRQAAPAEIQNLLTERESARRAKDFKRADLLRNALKAKGWLVEDTPKGPKLKPR
ncbi:MAG: cysteine--tRNA ligase [Verrucomicrobia bacterium]|nr:cysteine--tRNA ligase [Verrucomicrobiota bacterium]